MAVRRARAYWAVAPYRGELRSHLLPPPGEGEVLVQALYSAISRGTEALVCAGRVPASEYGRMRCPRQEGEFPFPVKYGYAVVGRVQQGPEALSGRLVFVHHPHQTRFVVAAEEAFPIPDGLPPQRAVLAAAMETALNGVWDAQPLPGERVLVIGAGLVGLLAAFLLSPLSGIELALVDVDGARGRIAEALGIPFRLPEEVEGEADLLIHASGAPEALARALGWAGFEARIVELSWYGDALVPLPLGAAFHSRRLRLISSQVGRIATPQRARWDKRRRMDKALALLQDPRLDLLVTGESRFEELPRLLPELARSARGVLCHRIRYR